LNFEIEETLPEVCQELVGKDPAEMRGLIIALEQKMLSHANHLTAVDLETHHHFAPGQYARELHIPQGMLLTGKIHKHAHLNIISKGDITVWTEDGMKRIKAPATIVSKPGMKRVGYAHEDTVWTTIHATNETDLVKLEEELIAKDFSEVPYDEKLMLEKEA
jgi:hypothetical protein